MKYIVHLHITFNLLIKSAFLPRLRLFQLTASRRGWPWSTLRCQKSGSISTHSLTKRLTIFFAFGLTGFYISTHSLTKRLTKLHCPVLYISIFQLTASRRGWHLGQGLPGQLVFISTHSLTKRLTAQVKLVSSTTTFQLTASRRGWRIYWTLLYAGNYISTHSLTKRLTLCFGGFLYVFVFQLTASRRGWLSSL